MTSAASSRSTSSARGSRSIQLDRSRLGARAEVRVLRGAPLDEVDRAAEDVAQLVEKAEELAESVHAHGRIELDQEVEVAAARIEAPGRCGAEQAQAAHGVEPAELGDLAP